ncbi:MAG TPA: 3-isopropylmalate dehydratase large subunit [Thermoplasmatales archaeon]|nr:3-isopropylmalate dehydratase large subunit [Thermoplasmatales archaeon]
MGMTISEKILARASGKERVEAGEIVEANVDLAMSHDNAALVSKIFKEIGVDKVWDPDKIVIILDHRAPANIIKAAEAHKSIREFIKERGIKNFYDVGEGICHQVVPEKGYVKPGMLIVGTDSHTTTYGAFGAFSTGIGATEMACVWATGKLWLKVPETIKMVINGKLQEMVTAKDVILHIIGEIGSDGANYKAIEFYGETVKNFSVSSRMTISNQAMEAGAKAAIVPPDEKTINYLRDRVRGEIEPVYSDGDANYESEMEFDVSDLEPQVACPHTVDNVKPVSEVEGIEIDQAVLGSCTNGRLEDLEIAAKILKGKRIAPGVRMIVIPASREIYLEALKRGYIEIFLRAGATIINPGCGPCLGAHQGVLASGERAISSTNRNFRGRMGSPDSEVYLASPATVAASAIEGKIVDPRRVVG